MTIGINMRKRVEELFNKGVQKSKIAQELGISSASVNNILEEKSTNMHNFAQKCTNTQQPESEQEPEEISNEDLGLGSPEPEAESEQEQVFGQCSECRMEIKGKTQPSECPNCKEVFD